jgi:hypothetical protein
MRDALGDGYTEALRKAWKGDVPESADFVMFWWQKAASEVVLGRCKQFGFITTNSIHQTFNRRVIEPFLAEAKKPLHLAYAIPDHPWIDSADGAAVRIAMTVAAPGKATGQLDKVITEIAHEDGENEVTLSTSEGSLAANLQVGADIGSCSALQANANIVSRGVQTIGEGFVLTFEETEELRASNPDVGNHIRPYLNGKDLTDKPRRVSVIDFFGLSEADALRIAPGCFQRLLTLVRPHRLQNSRASYRNNWWILGEPQPALRIQMEGLHRVIVTPVTAKHRFFVFLDTATLPDQALNTICIDDAFFLAVLSSQLHVVWSLAAGGRLGMGNDPRYNNTRCFEPFPFPALEEGALKQRIRDLGERLDAHRKRQQALHPDLTLTGLYNVLEKLRSLVVPPSGGSEGLRTVVPPLGGALEIPEPPKGGTTMPSPAALTPKEREIHDQGLVSVLKQIHDDLDAAVLEAYGWTDLATAATPPADLLAQGGPAAEALEQQLLTRLVSLNHERAAEEQRGHIRYLRPDYQAPDQVSGSKSQVSSESPLPLEDAELETPNLKLETQVWPADLPAQVTTLRKLLSVHGPDAETLSACFGRKSQKRSDQITAILATLRALGHLA